VRCAIRNSAYLVSRIEQHPRCVLLLAPEFINVCFWWVPQRLAHLAHDSQEFLSQVLCMFLAPLASEVETMQYRHQRVSFFINHPSSFNIRRTLDTTNNSFVYSYFHSSQY
jgi:hypothetical protein